MTTKHTPGPWHYAECQMGTPFVDTESVGDLFAAALPLDEQIANAHLIAAAPDLLEALEAAHGWLVLVGTDHLEPVRARCRAAIAKAKGQSSSTDTARATE